MPCSGVIFGAHRVRLAPRFGQRPQIPAPHDSSATRSILSVTGEPAVRLVQSIKSGFLTRAWRYAFRVDAAPSLKPHPFYHLWESPSGLHFFDPMVEGDHEFYASLYSRLSFIDSGGSITRAMSSGWRHVTSIRATVCLTWAVGLPPSATRSRRRATSASIPISRKGAGSTTSATRRWPITSLTNAGQYDVACAFQVLEHLTNPAATFADLVRAVRPGGLVIIGVPHVPSAATRIPNFLINAPPHHLTWWTRSALTALAERNGTSVVAIEQVPWGTQDALGYWAARFSPIRCKDIYFKKPHLLAPVSARGHHRRKDHA